MLYLLKYVIPSVPKLFLSLPIAKAQFHCKLVYEMHKRSFSYIKATVRIMMLPSDMILS